MVPITSAYRFIQEGIRNLVVVEANMLAIAAPWWRMGIVTHPTGRPSRCGDLLRGAKCLDVRAISPPWRGVLSFARFASWRSCEDPIEAVGDDQD
jgi:hypothetical protein